ESLRRRPMKRVAEPLTRMGATIVGREDGGRLPLAVRGAALPRAIAYDTPVASAQVKSAILLAGLRADGPVTVREPAPSRDHSEVRSEEHTSELQSLAYLVCRLLLEKKK